MAFTTDELMAHIRYVRNMHPSYGYRKITAYLKSLRYVVSEQRVLRTMNLMGVN